MNPSVHTTTGVVCGYEDGGIFKFHGIPYAKPPIGTLRFRPPERPEPWDGVLDATKRGYAAPQYPSNLDQPMGPLVLPTSEDCLTLAVSTPSLDGSLPVAVWFHGGANCYCSGDLPWYDGASLARSQQIVEVNITFRLGVFGFLFLEGVQEQNLCIEDQMLALRWVQENISKFGGDPSRVTLFGQSAGANSIAHILSREDSRGLFQQVALQSASLGRGNHLRTDAFAVGRAVVESLGLDPNSPDLLEKLQAQPVDALLRAAEEGVPAEIVNKHQGMYFKPVMDAWHTPEETALRAAEMAVKRGIKVLIGFTRDEMHAFCTDRDPDSLAALKRAQHLRYELPGGVFARAVADGGRPIWKYQFDWAAPDSIYNSCHCLELPFLFGNLETWDAPFLAGTQPEEAARLTKTIQDAWGAFFRDEMPGEDVWPRYDSHKKQIKYFDNQANSVDTEPLYEV